MARTLNFNTFEKPMLMLTMRDAAQTAFTVTTPTEELVEKLQANLETILEAFKAGGLGSLAQAWDLAAELISCNLEGHTVTGAELKTKYGMDYLMLFAFFAEYNEFITDIENAKN